MKRTLSIVRRFYLVGLAVLGLTYWTTCHLFNKVQETPTTPEGVSYAGAGDTTRYQTTVADSAGDSLKIRFDWGDGTMTDWSALSPSPETVSTPHRWTKAETCQVRAQASDRFGATSDWSPALTVIVGKNRLPGKPTTPSGPALVSGESSFVFTTWSNDPEQDMVSCRFDWGDGDTSAWSDPVPSGHVVAMRHCWQGGGFGRFTIRTQARDTGGALSSWSDGYQLRRAAVFGGKGSDVANSVQQTTDGGYIIAGYTNSYGAGDYDVWLIKTDASGNKVWDKTFGGARADFGNSIQQTSDGGYVIAGEAAPSGSGYGNAWLIKTDASGNKVWDKTFGGNEEDFANSVQQTTDGGYIIAGETDYFGHSNGDAWLIRTDASGNEVWDKRFDRNSRRGWDQANSAQQTSDGGYIVTGFTCPPDTGILHLWLIKTDTSGNETWDKVIGPVGDNEGQFVRQVADGGYIIAGYVTDGGALIKTDASGNEAWRMVVGNWWYQAASSAEPTSDGGYIVTGRTFRDGSNLADIWMIKTDASGNKLWVRTFGGPEDDFSCSVLQTSDGGYVVGGYTFSIGAGQSDVCLIKTDSSGN